MTEYIDDDTWARVLPRVSSGADIPMSAAIRLLALSALTPDGKLESSRGRVVQDLVARAGLTPHKTWNEIFSRGLAVMRKSGLVDTTAHQGAGTLKVELSRPLREEQAAELRSLMPAARRVLMEADKEIAADANSKRLPPARRQRPQIYNSQSAQARAAARGPRLRGRFRLEDAIPEGGGEINPRIAAILAEYQ